MAARRAAISCGGRYAGVAVLATIQSLAWGKRAGIRGVRDASREILLGCSAHDHSTRHFPIVRYCAGRTGGAADADDGTVPRDQGSQSRPAAVLSHGRFLRDVLRGRRNRFACARHRADQARQASGRRYPDVRRAGGTRRRLSAPADRPRPSRRGVRADGRPRRRPQARQQERGPARRRAAGDARHADRRQPARRPRQQLPAGNCAHPRLLRRRPHRSGVDRYLDRGIHGHRSEPRRTRRDAGADQPERSHRHRRAL